MKVWPFGAALRGEVSNRLTERIARKLTPNGTGTAERVHAAEVGQVRRQKRRDRDELRSNYQQSYWAAPRGRPPAGVIRRSAAPGADVQQCLSCWPVSGESW